MVEAVAFERATSIVTGLQAAAGQALDLGEKVAENSRCAALGR